MVDDVDIKIPETDDVCEHCVYDYCFKKYNKYPTYIECKIENIICWKCFHQGYKVIVIRL
jgi:hypothetical protein